MQKNISSSRWIVSPDDFAVRITISDLRGWIGKSLVIEAGTRALVIEEGVLLGEVPAGEYTFETFLDCLEFWRKKQTTVFLTRTEDQFSNGNVRKVPCLEGLCFDFEFEWTLQMRDLVAFLHNFMGAREAIPLVELQDTLSPMIDQSIRETVGQYEFEEILKPGFKSALTDGIRARVDTRMMRYGLVFLDLNTIQPSYEGRRIEDKRGELFLAARETQLQSAAADVENDRLKARLEDYQAKVPVRSELRELVSDDKLAKIQNQEDFKKAITDVDKQRLLRKEDIESLIEAYEERKEDREQQRQHLLATLDLQREQELEELRLDLDHAVRMKSMEKEIEFARLSRAADAEQWEAELERDKQEADHRWQQKLDKTKAKWDRIRESRRQGRDDDFEAIQHEQKMEDIAADLELARAERQRKITLLDEQLNTRLAAERLEVQKRQQEWELEFRQQKSANQIERLQKVQEMNARFAEQQQRIQVELENLKEDSSHKREMERMQAMGGMSTEAMIALAGSENAALLADLKKHEASQDAAKAQAAASPDAALNEERLRMHEKLNETERAKADAIAQAYQMAMQSQQANVGQMIEGLAQAATPVAPVTPRPITQPTSTANTSPAVQQPAPASAPPPMPTADVWHVSLNGTQSPPMNFAQVQQAIQGGQVNAETMVWKTGMAQWEVAGKIPELASCFGPPPMPGPLGPPPA